MDALEFLKTRSRMCEGGCYICPANASYNGYNVSCTALARDYPEVFIAIVTKWSETHRFKTRLDKLKELYPNIECLHGVPTLCPLTFEGKSPEEFGCIGKSCSHCREEYWEGEYVQK